MKPARFDYVRADSLGEVLEVLRRHGDEARVLAGGQSLVPMLSMRLATPKVLVDIMHVPELRTLNAGAGGLRVGAAVRQAELERWPDLARRQPLLAAALNCVGHVQTRSRGAVCGSIAHADPSAELPLALVALGGEVHLRGPRKARRLPAKAFFAGMMATAKAEDEMIEAVTFPLAAGGAGYAFREVGRRHGDFAIVACAAAVGPDGVRLAVGGVADFPTVQAMPAAGAPELDEALNQFAWDLQARDDLHATARYRRELVRRLGRSVIEEASRCAA